MEPTRTKIRYALLSEVIVTERHTSGPNNSEKKLGWFLQIKGSRELIFLGMEEPPIKTGDQVKILIEKV